METLLSVKNLSVGISPAGNNSTGNASKGNFPSETLVKNISFDIYEGEIAGLVGESGSGKTLTALSVAGLLDENTFATKGDVLLGGVNLLSLQESEMRKIRGKEISMIFQEPFSSLNPLMKAGAQIAETLELHASSQEACGEKGKELIQNQVIELMDKLKLPEPDKLMNTYPHRLSGGMCQRVMIALAMICRPRLLIADEPTTALDLNTQNQILDLLKSINRDLGTSILFISHDLGVVKNLCERTLVMHSGSIVEEGDTEKTFSAPVHEYTKGLLSSVPSASGEKMSKGNLTVKEPFLKIRGLSCAYSSRSLGVFGRKEIKPVLDKIDLEIGRGEIFGLVGESGCGKTTLGKCVLGLKDYEGEISVNGRSIDRLKGHLKDRARGFDVQAVFQDSGSSLNPVKTAAFTLEEPLRAHAIGNRASGGGERRRKADRMLELVGLDASYRNRKPAELSAGQKQRVAIGAALMLEPGLIVADEPVSALDVSTGAQIISLFRDLNRRLGLAFLFISHNLDLVYGFCDRVAVMKDGRLFFPD
jgi:ABC-type glutathione transport system ATPase component